MQIETCVTGGLNGLIPCVVTLHVLRMKKKQQLSCFTASTGFFSFYFIFLHLIVDL